jgi:hypothetical protein
VLVAGEKGAYVGGSEEVTMSRFNLRIFLLLALLSLVTAISGRYAMAHQSDDPRPGQSQRNAEGKLKIELLAKAQPDECFVGVGEPYPPGPPCDTGQPKVNAAYVWGLTKSGPDLWFGTGPNIHCLVLSGYLGIVEPNLTDSWVCEFGASQYVPPLPPALGDWRSPSIYVYDTDSDTLTEKTPFNPLIALTSGLRSAGTHQGVVFLGGPALLPEGGVNLFAFNVETEALVGATTLLEYNNIRKWIVADDVLYTAVRNLDGTGSVLRWTGSVTDPFRFDVVGHLPSEGAELAVHEGRLFVSTWPRTDLASPETAGLIMSPPLPPGGLTEADAGNWVKVWAAEAYEPDPVTAVTYGGGALASYGGYLFWGTMHVPFTSALAHFTVHGTPSSTIKVVESIFASQRAISLFRGKDFDSGEPQVDLLYGSYLLPVFVPATETETVGDGLWLLLPNNMGQKPLFGQAGFGNHYNNYTWTMAVHQDKLYVGTMDYSYLINEGMASLLSYILGTPVDPALIPSLPLADFGADIYRFRQVDEPAAAISVDGAGNYSNYGIRTMLADDALYLGTANPMNLMTDPDDELPEGGWELLRLSERGRPVYLPSVRRP